MIGKDKKRIPTFLILLVILTLAIQSVDAQTGCGVLGNYCMSTTTLNICGGTLFDDGGGNAYTDTPYTLTICPDNPGDVIQLSFSAFALQTSPNGNNSDYLTIYDGPTTGAPSLGSYTGSSLQGLPVTATVNNASGCLTLVFDPNGNPNAGSPGFEAQVICTTPCATPTAGFDYLDPQPNNGSGSVSICVGSPVSFQNAGSTAEPGFTLEQYNWNFDDGTIDSTSGSTVSHVFAEPGEYLVALTVIDNNGCGSLNLEPLQVLVSTIPQFPGLELIQTQYCFGEAITLDGGEIVNPTWTALPPQVVSGQTYLADGAGFSYSSSLVFDFFEQDAVLENCNDLYSILVNMEHSYMGDLGITISCPNGTTVDLVEWGTNGGGGTFLGLAIDDESTNPGIGWDYFWAPGATNGTWGQNAGGFNTSLPSGTYQAAGNLCDLVGCPLNGSWTFSVTDNLAIDNGYIFEWGINFNPSLIPGLTTFTPTVGADADSSYWSGPFITSSDAGLDIINISLPEPGSYDYTYTVVNSFGCSFDSTITVVVDQSPFVTAGEDLLFNCTPLTIDGGWLDIPTPLCTTEEGTYTYCYGDNENYVVTYCPDNPGDGLSSVQLTFIAGSTENFFDQITIYDGNSTSSPVLASGIMGDLAGLSWTATGVTGCLTLSLTSDGSASCQSGSQTEWNYTVACSSPFDYIWLWSPSAGLGNPNSPVTTLNSLSTTTVFTLTGYPVGHPDCAVTDDVVITVPPTMQISLTDFYEICLGDTAHVTAPTIVGGAAPYVIQWEDNNGNLISGDSFDSSVIQPTDYCVTVQDDCDVTQTECITVNIYPQIPASFSILDGLGCEPLSVLFTSDYTNFQDIDLMVWNFDDGSLANTMGSANHQYSQSGIYWPWLEITDIHGCVYIDTTGNPVNVWPTPFAVFNTDPTIAILPNTTFNFVNLSIDATEFEWRFDEFGGSAAQDTVFTFPVETADSYWVDLYVSNAYGCVDSARRQLVVQDDIDIYIPNSFTPDGDGINDAWLVQGKGFQDVGYHMQVFNRWGDVVFDSTDPKQAWTGGYNGGNYYSQDGIYLYRAEIRDIQNDVTHLYEGHVTIIR